MANDVYKESGLLLFGLEIKVNGEASGDIMLNPGRYKLPRPLNQENSYKYFGYIIAADLEDALDVFKDNWREPIPDMDPVAYEQEIAELAKQNHMGSE